MIYVTMVQDRHTDTEPYLFSTLEKAVAFAKGIIEDYAHQFGSRLNQPDEVMTEEELARAGWLFYGRFSVEGDCVWVLPVEVDVEVDAKGTCT